MTEGPVVRITPEIRKKPREFSMAEELAELRTLMGEKNWREFKRDLRATRREFVVTPKEIVEYLKANTDKIKAYVELFKRFYYIRSAYMAGLKSEPGEKLRDYQKIAMLNEFIDRQDIKDRLDKDGDKIDARMAKRESDFYYIVAGTFVAEFLTGIPADQLVPIDDKESSGRLRLLSKKGAIGPGQVYINSSAKSLRHPEPDELRRQMAILRNGLRIMGGKKFRAPRPVDINNPDAMYRTFIRAVPNAIAVAQTLLLKFPYPQVLIERRDDLKDPKKLRKLFESYFGFVDRNKQNARSSSELYADLVFELYRAYQRKLPEEEGRIIAMREKAERDKALAAGRIIPARPEVTRREGK